MTSSPHSRTTAELAATVEDAIDEAWSLMESQMCCSDAERATTEREWDKRQAALRELRSRAEQQPPNPDIAPEVWARSNRLIRERAERTEAAERERDHMRAALERIEENARQGKIRSEMMRVDCLLDSQEWPVHETIHAFSVIRMIARAGLSQPGTKP